MGKIVAIGGGENGRPGTKYETETLDREIVLLSGKKTSKFLFIGLANKFSDSYYDVMCNIYGNMYGCYTEYLTEYDIKNEQTASDKIENADIIYVGGGNTLRLMTLLRKNKIDILLKKAYINNTIMCGVSAGAICWCDFGNDDSRRFTSGSDQLIKVKGLGFIHILMCPHFDSENNRKTDLPRMMKTTTKIPAIALDNGAALVVNEDKFKIISSMDNANAMKCYWKKGEYISETLKQNIYQDIKLLYNKN
jgi:dipeptidase E